MADNTREKMKTERAERLRQFNERIDAAIDQWVHDSVCFAANCYTLPETSPCWASSFSSQHDVTRVCCWARAPAGDTRRRRPQLSIDISTCSQCAQQQASRTPLLLSVDGTDRWTDGRTDGRTDARPLHRSCSAFKAYIERKCAGNYNKRHNIFS